MAIDTNQFADAAEAYLAGGSGAASAAPKGMKSWLKSAMKGGTGKSALGGMAGYAILQYLMNAGEGIQQQSFARKEMDLQKEVMTPEALYYQAALPQAKAEEEQARTALLTQMSGGLIGPSLAKGERLIGR